MNIHHRALIPVADGQRCLLLRNEGNFPHPVLKVEAEGEQGSDWAGRTFAASGSRRSAMEQTEFHQLEMDGFAKQVAAILQDRAEKHNFDELIVVAPPHTLSELRKHRGEAVAKRLVAEVDKELTKHAIEHVTEILINHASTAPDRDGRDDCHASLGAGHAAAKGGTGDPGSGDGRATGARRCLRGMSYRSAGHRWRDSSALSCRPGS